MPSMRSDKVVLALIDIRDNIRLAQSFLGDLTAQDLQASRLHFYAVTRALEIISEASRRLPDDLRARHPHLPWRNIMGVGNIYRHNYDAVQEEMIWETITHHLTPLLIAIETEIKSLPD